ncbi:MAG: hypothetical protein IJB92_04520 [Clostridia bacterium]|nr:hypothetical protein [Clostridia bacterium]
MRVIAAFIIGIAGIWLGFALSESMSKRARTLMSIKSAFEEIKRRVVNLGQPLAEAFAAASPLMLDVAEAIMLGSDTPFTGCGASAYLYRADIACLNEQIRQMYLMDKHNCKNVCEGAVERIGQLSLCAQVDASKNGRLMRTLCTCMGIAAAVLIV